MASTRPKRAATTASKTSTEPQAKKTVTKTAAKVPKPAQEKAAKVTKSTANKKTTKSAATTKTTKPVASKAPAKSTAKATGKAKPQTNGVAANISKKRKAQESDDEKASKKNKTTAAKTKTTAKSTAQEPRESDAAEVPARKKVAAKGKVINEVPTTLLEVLVFGEGSAGELGLGTAKNAVDVKRPRVNANLATDKAAVVQMSAGGMHSVALTANNTILTWGINDTKALGRSTEWDGGLRDVDAEDEEDEDDDSGLNPHEATPAEVDFSTTPLPEDTKWVKVVAGDSCSLALTDDGKVYGWGTFRGNEGGFGFTPGVETADRPILIDGLKNIVDIACGANHALALDNKGIVFAWGSGEQNQLGRRVVERNKKGGLLPREVEMPRAAKKKVKSIESGQFHSFAITNDNEVFAWGLNAFGQTGVTSENAGDDGAMIASAQHVQSLAGKNIVSIAGGAHHSIAATADGDCLVWGRVDSGQMGIPKSELAGLGESVKKNDRGQLGMLTVPTKAALVKGKTAIVAAGTDNSFAITTAGKLYSCGFSTNYQTGLGVEDDVDEWTLIDNTAIRDRVINGAYPGGQFSIITAGSKPVA